MEGPGFITVKYGENKEELFNTWCPCLVLLKNMQKKCIGEDKKHVQTIGNGDIKPHIPSKLTIDLVDLKGGVKNIREHLDEYAHNYIDPRETYVLINIEINEEEESIKYTSLLKNVERLHPVVKAKLDSLSSRKPITTSKGSRWAAIKTVTKLTALSKKANIASGVPAEKGKNTGRRGSVASEANSESGRKTPSGKSGKTRKKSKESR